MSIRCSGEASRSFIIGSRLWPPAMMRAPAPTRSSAARAPSTLVARSYSNGPGVCTRRPFVRGGLAGRHALADAGLLARLVLLGRIGADHRRARHALRMRLAALRVQLARGEASAGGVPQRRPVRAGRRDRRFAPQTRKRERPLRVHLGDPGRGYAAALLVIAEPDAAGAGVDTVDQADRVLQSGLL